MARAFLFILDSVGIGGAPDADAYGDPGADTLGHVAEACARGAADRVSVRRGPLRLPHLVGLGLGEACRLATGRVPPGLELAGTPTGAFGCASEVSNGKDTPSGHWEIAGVPVMFDWGYFPKTRPCFPAEAVAQLCRRAALPGILGDCHASGTEIVARLGEEHVRTGKPICYTSADSVFQIATHEDSFGLERLYEVCEVARRIFHPLRIGRIIARPFTGAPASGFVRTANRRDYSIPPPKPTVLALAETAGRAVVSIGKIGDIYAHVGTGTVLKADGNEAVFDRALHAAATLPEGGLLVANFGDFDTHYGHRRDVVGYAAALERLDARFPPMSAALHPGDLLIVTADPWMRSNVARHRPHARTGSNPRRRARGARRVGRHPCDVRRYRGDDRRAPRAAAAAGRNTVPRELHTLSATATIFLRQVRA